MRLLDARKIAYQSYAFPDTIRNAFMVAEEVGVPPAQVFKTLVLLREDQPASHPLLIMVPADHEVDLRHLAQIIGSKSVRMAAHDQAEKLTGLKVGGISALALLHKPFDMFLDEQAMKFEQILISGGQRGVEIQLHVADLLAVTNAQLIDATGANSA
jgi:Cys-tRNA(Pro)/Cys-tRNA(Cys) deacylase